jgi:hypothetical protein
MTRFRRLRQLVAWGAAGAILSPWIGAPLWTLTGQGRASDALPLATAVAGAVLGLVALAKLPMVHRRRGATLFGVTYPPMLVWWAAWVARDPRGFLWFLGSLGLCGGLVAIVHTVPPRVAAELRRLAAASAWVASILMMPAYLSGLIVVPLATSLTIVVRRSHGRQPSRARSMAATSAV